MSRAHNQNSADAHLRAKPCDNCRFEVFKVIQITPGITRDELISHFDLSKWSDSGIRTRVAELIEKNIVQDDHAKPYGRLFAANGKSYRDYEAIQKPEQKTIIFSGTIKSPPPVR